MITTVDDTHNKSSFIDAIPATVVRGRMREAILAGVEPLSPQQVIALQADAVGCFNRWIGPDDELAPFYAGLALDENLEFRFGTALVRSRLSQADIDQRLARLAQAQVRRRGDGKRRAAPIKPLPPERAGDPDRERLRRIMELLFPSPLDRSAPETDSPLPDRVPVEGVGSAQVDRAELTSAGEVRIDLRLAGIDGHTIRLCFGHVELARGMAESGGVQLSGRIPAELLAEHSSSSSQSLSIAGLLEHVFRLQVQWEPYPG